MKTISPIIEYQDKILDINLNRIEPNIYNPRERFNEEEEDELIESILTKGILNPIVVYKRRSDGKYIILDGERRYRACKKLNIREIPARILVREPSVLESLSLMFHIHNVRQEWTEFAISLTIKRIVDELGKNVSFLTPTEIKDLSKITSLSEYRVRKYLKFLDYPDDVIEMFLKHEVSQKGTEGPDPDILLEMHKPINDIKYIMPELLNEFSVKTIIDSCIQKKEQGIIKANKEFRLVSQSLTAAKNGEINKMDLKRNLRRFLTNIEYTPERVYHETAETLYQFKHIKKNSESFLRELKLFDFNSIDTEKRNEVISILEEILKTIKKVF
jgi:ParB family transcriptional regulator, chromosome partitioning protein